MAHGLHRPSDPSRDEKDAELYRLFVTTATASADHRPVRVSKSIMYIAWMYCITGLIRRQSDEALLVEEGTLYPALWRLENKGLLEAEWGLSENNRKDKFYRLTRRAGD